MVVEHNLDLIKCDWIIDFGSGGENGGQLLAVGTLDNCKKQKSEFI
jgi:excinuclease UvrABC ATPase subunit